MLASHHWYQPDWLRTDRNEASRRLLMAQGRIVRTAKELPAQESVGNCRIAGAQCGITALLMKDHIANRIFLP